MKRWESPASPFGKERTLDERSFGVGFRFVFAPFVLRELACFCCPMKTAVLLVVLLGLAAGAGCWAQKQAPEDGEGVDRRRHKGPWFCHGHDCPHFKTVGARGRSRLGSSQAPLTAVCQRVLGCDRLCACCSGRLAGRRRGCVHNALL